jgi:glycosyltransferase involved in cell wall biosynthesis
VTTSDHRPTITVILVCYREGALLYRAMESLDRQTDRDFDIVLVNDASPCAETNRICREFSARPNVHLIMRRRNGGLSATRNDGFAAATGELCMPLDGDDELPPRAVEAVRSAAMCHPEAGFYFGNYRVQVEDTGESSVKDTSRLADDDGWLCPRHLATHWGLLGTTPCRRVTWERVHGYRNLFSYDYQDVDFWMRVVGSGARGAYVPETIYVWHRSASGMNAAMKPWRAWEVAVRNRRFQEVGSDWATVREAFLDHVIGNSAMPEVRSLMRREGWRVWPTRRADWPLFLRAWARVVLPVRLTAQIVELKRGKRERGRCEGMTE